MKIDNARLWAGLLSGMLTACVPQAYEQQDYRKHLTQKERQQLQDGRPVDKVHISYWRFTPRQVYWQGPLRAEVDRPGHVRFTEHGTWYSFHRSGAVRDTIVYGADTKTNTVRHYRENGELYLALRSARTQREGRAFIEEVDVEFRAGNRRDTMSIRRWGHFEGEAKTVLDERIDFDEQGHRKPLQKLK